MKVKKPPAHPSGVTAPKFNKDQLPKHVAVVMDANGRWAKIVAYQELKDTRRAKRR